MKKTKWGKKTKHPEVQPFPAGDSAGEPCVLPLLDPNRPCNLLLGEHGLALVGPENIPTMVHEGDLIEGSGDTLVLESHGMRYGEEKKV
jgi:hypothetical protein